MNFPELCAYINKLKVKQCCLEKAEGDFIRNIDTNYNKAFQEEYDKLKKFREHEFLDVFREVQENFHFLYHIKEKIARRTLENININKLKNDMLALENCTDYIKKRITSELENLASEEMALTIEVTNKEMKILDMNKHEKDCNKVSKYSAKYANDHKLQGEVKEFSSFLNETGGHDGGWPHEDNALFLKIYNKIKNKKSLTQYLQKIFPDMTKDKIEFHIDWYKSYMELRNKQKLAIEKWRENKNKTTTNEINNTISQDDKQKYLMNKQTNKIIREKVRKWRQEKGKQIEQDIKIQTENSTKTKEIETKKQVKNQDKKKEIRKWKTVKEAKVRAENLEKEIQYLREKERRMLLANKLIREFQEQDNIFITKRMNNLKINVVPPNLNKNHQNMKLSIARNPERLYKPTKQWLARTSNDGIQEINNMQDVYLMLKQIPKLAKPTWRQAIPQI